MRRIALLVVAVVAVVVLGVGQLVLPGIAAQRLRDHLSRSGTVLQVKVEAFPAIELLWHQADRVVVRMQSYRSTPGPLGDLLAEAGDVGSVDAATAELDAGLLTLRDATLRKRGDQLSGSGSVSEADLRSALPILQSVQAASAPGGQLTVRGTATLLGLSATVQATVSVQDGAVVVSPDVPFGQLASVTVFRNPHLQVEQVGATPGSGGFSVYGQARLQ